MARQSAGRDDPSARQVTADRAARLFKLITMLTDGPKTRPALLRGLESDVRKFYRDLELLRALGVRVELGDRGYELKDKAEQALAAVPFPDPQLTLHEAAQLAQGRTAAHKRLREAFEAFTGRPFANRPATKPKK